MAGHVLNEQPANIQVTQTKVTFSSPTKFLSSREDFLIKITRKFNIFSDSFTTSPFIISETPDSLKMFHLKYIFPQELLHNRMVTDRVVLLQATLEHSTLLMT